MEPKKMALLILLITTAFWGGNFVVGKVVVNYIPPFMMSLGRWIIALFLLIPMLYKKGWPKFDEWKGYWFQITILSLSGIVGFTTLVYFAVKYTTAVNAALVNSLTPAVIVLLSWIVLSERLTKIQLLGILVSIIGVIIVISRGSAATFINFQFNIGDLLMIIAVILWGIYSIIMKKLTVHLSSLAVTTLSAIIAMMFLLPLTFWELINTERVIFNATTVFGLIYIGVFASVLAFLGWNNGVIKLGPGKAGVFINLIPVYAALFSFLFLNEKLQIHQITGGIIVIIGVLITNYNDLLKKKA